MPAPWRGRKSWMGKLYLGDRAILIMAVHVLNYVAYSDHSFLLQPPFFLYQKNRFCWTFWRLQSILSGLTSARSWISAASPQMFAHYETICRCEEFQIRTFMVLIFSYVFNLLFFSTSASKPLSTAKRFSIWLFTFLVLTPVLTLQFPLSIRRPFRVTLALMQASCTFVSRTLL